MVSENAKKLALQQFMNTVTIYKLSYGKVHPFQAFLRTRTLQKEHYVFICP